MKKKKDNETKRKIDLIIKIVLIIIIILLLIHNCVLRKEKDKYQNQLVPNGNVDIIDIKCDDNKCKPVKEIESLSFTQKNISILKGDTLELIVNIKPAELSSSKLTWKSSDSKVVSVDSNGKIKGLSNGTAIITVTSSNGKTAKCTVTVTSQKIDVKEIKVSLNDSVIKEGSSTQIITMIEPENATNRELIFSSSNSSIATVDNKGVVKGIKAGIAVITVMTKDGKVKGTVTITVESNPTPTPTITPTPTATPMEITSLKFTQENVSVVKGDSLELIVEIKPIELSSSKLTWSSSDNDIVSVDSNGKIRGINVGIATITVTSSNGKEANCIVTVTTDVIEVSKITLSSSNTTIEVGKTTQVVATIEPENATDRNLIYSSSDTAVATVDNKGIVTGVMPGVVTITVKTKDGKVKGTITITVKSAPTPTPTPTATPEPDNDDGTETFKVYDKEYTPVLWNGADDLKIFTRSIYNVDGVIAPESTNTYQFIVKNSTEYNVKYKITFIETNDYNINMKYKLKKNDTYIIDHYVSYDELSISEQQLGTNSKDVYYLEWKWVSSSNDTSIGQTPDVSYGLQILVEAESINE